MSEECLQTGKKPSKWNFYIRYAEWNLQHGRCILTFFTNENEYSPQHSINISQEIYEQKTLYCIEVYNIPTLHEYQIINKAPNFIWVK